MANNFDEILFIIYEGITALTNKIKKQTDKKKSSEAI